MNQSTKVPVLCTHLAVERKSECSHMKQLQHRLFIELLPSTSTSTRQVKFRVSRSDGQIEIRLIYIRVKAKSTSIVKSIYRDQRKNTHFRSNIEGDVYKPLQ